MQQLTQNHTLAMRYSAVTCDMHHIDAQLVAYMCLDHMSTQLWQKINYLQAYKFSMVRKRQGYDANVTIFLLALPYMHKTNKLEIPSPYFLYHAELCQDQHDANYNVNTSRV